MSPTDRPTDRSDLFRLVYRSRSAIAGSPAEVQRVVGTLVAAVLRLVTETLAGGVGAAFAVTEGGKRFAPAGGSGGAGSEAAQDEAAPSAGPEPTA